MHFVSLCWQQSQYIHVKVKHRQEREFKNCAEAGTISVQRTVATLLSSDALVPIELAVRERKTRVPCGLEGASQKQSA